MNAQNLSTKEPGQQTEVLMDQEYIFWQTVRKERVTETGEEPNEMGCPRLSYLFFLSALAF